MEMARILPRGPRSDGYIEEKIRDDAASGGGVDMWFREYEYLVFGVFLCGCLLQDVYKVVQSRNCTIAIMERITTVAIGEFHRQLYQY